MKTRLHGALLNLPQTLIYFVTTLRIAAQNHVSTIVALNLELAAKIQKM